MVENIFKEKLLTKIGDFPITVQNVIQKMWNSELSSGVTSSAKSLKF